MSLFDTFVYSKNWEIRVLRHVVFWATDCISNLVVLSADTEIKTSVIISRILVVPLAASVTYFIIYYLIPTFSKDHNRIRLVLGIFAAVAFVGFGIRYYRVYLIYPLVDPSHVFQHDIWTAGYVFKEIFRWMPGISLAIAIKMMKNKTEIQEKAEHLIEEKKAAELAFLKAQMHPHFLFNTLNTLYSYSIKNADKSELVVLHLANLMRYILEECDHRVIPIEKEIKVIEDYFELKKLRHGSRLQIDCQIKLNGCKTYISPLIFLPIIENSFKHTLSSNRGTIHISVQIRSDKDFIYLYVENDLLSHEDNGSARGMGIANVKRQLALLYGQRFNMDIKNGQGKYSVNLKVPALDKNF
jgi:two-component system, LytTR family, sensor kinase